MAISNLLVRVRLEGVEQAQAGLQRVGRGFETATRAAQASAAAAATFATHVGLATSAVTGLVGALALNAGVSFDSLTRGLATVSSNAEDLTTQLSRLQEVAKLPGLSLEQAVRGSLALQTVGLSANLAERALKAFGNAAASSGGSSEDMAEALRQVSQIISSGKLQAEELNVIAERIPQARAALLQMFGTLSGQELQGRGLTAQQIVEGLIAGLERLPSVSGGAANAIENIGDAFQKALRPLGQGLVEALAAATPFIEGVLGELERRMRTVGEVIAAVARSGVLANALKSFNGLLGGNLEGFRTAVAGIAATLLTVVQNLPKTFTDLQQYAVALFETIGHNVRETFRFAQEATRSFISGIGAAVSAVVKPLLAVMAALAPSALTPVVSQLLNGLTGLKALGNFVFDPVAPPQYRAAPSFPGLNLLEGRDANLASILGAIRPLGLPEGLAFAGQGTAPAVPSPMEERQNTLLANIERNTANAANELSLRRQALGGGPLAQLGITPAELAAATGGRGLAPGETEYRAPISQMDNYLRQIVRADGAKSRFRPR